MPKKPVIYLDHAAATPLDSAVQTAMQPYLSEQFYNPSATYGPALVVRRSLNQARTTIGHHLGARPSEIVFTAGGSEANNLAIHGVMRRFPDANLVVSSVEHESVQSPAGRYQHREVPVRADGRLELENIRKNIDDKTVLVSIMYANNEIGTIQPLRDVGQLVSEIRQQRRRQGKKLPLYLHSDACQAANYLDLHVSRLGVDLLSINGGKIYGPKQSGALYVKSGLELIPLIDGGGQERGLRSGTENVAAIVGLATALDRVQSNRKVEGKRLQGLQRHFFERVNQQLPHAIINGSQSYRLPNNLHLTLLGTDNERLLIQLEAEGILAAAGSACSASNEEASHVLSAIGLDDSRARASLRLTMGQATTLKMIEHTVHKLAALAG